MGVLLGRFWQLVVSLAEQWSIEVPILVLFG